MTFRSTTRETTTIGENALFISLIFRNVFRKVLLLFFLANRLVMNDYQLTSFQSVGGAREVSQHQAVLQEGPTNSPNFRIHGWTFHVRGVDMRLSMHVNDPPSVKKAVSSELERIIIGALKQVHRDGAQLTDLVHFYLECAGLDFSFCYNRW